MLWSPYVPYKCVASKLGIPVHTYTQYCFMPLKPMDSFGTWRNLKIIIFCVNAEFYRVVWTINALLTVHSEMLPFSGNNQNIQMFGVPRTLCHRLCT